MTTGGDLGEWGELNYIPWKRGSEKMAGTSGKGVLGVPSGIPRTKGTYDKYVPPLCYLLVISMTTF